MPLCSPLAFLLVMLWTLTAFAQSEEDCMSSHNKSRECIKLRETINKVYCGKGNTSCFFKIKNPEEEKAHSWANWLHAKEPLLRKIPRSQLKKVLQMSLELNIAAWQISVCKNPNQESVWHDDVSSNLSELLKIKRSIERLAPNDSSSELSEAFRRSTTTLYDNDTVYIAEFAVKIVLRSRNPLRNKNDRLGLFGVYCRIERMVIGPCCVRRQLQENFVFFS